MIEKGTRTLSGFGTALLWAGVAVSVSEIWAGSLLQDAGLFAGLLIIVIGHLFGGLVLSASGTMGTRYGIMSMQSTRMVLGNRGSIIPSLLNVFQLVGWATIMLALSGSIGASVGHNLGVPFNSKAFWVLLIGAGTLAWSFLVGSSKLQWVHTVVIIGLVLISALMTWIALNPHYYTMKPAAAESFSFTRGMRLMDLVIVMPISWVPLISDYSRLTKSERGGFWGSFWGYGIVSCWMYGIGLVISLATGTEDPAANILRLMGTLGLTIPAVVLVFASTMTSDFPDIYSSACSLFNINSKIKPAWTMWGTGILTIILALFFDLSRFETFLNVVGAFFIPLFAILLTDYFLIRRQDLTGLDFTVGSGMNFSGGFRISGLLVWGIGTFIYFFARAVDCPLGASITAFLASSVIYLLLEKRINHSKNV
ncbi:cytosine permease [Sediminispirochaeta bajacaliforniensis]|uniref:cytosine permease n=1 Tax=Sediminispirochaeta bajacaliforniensis TaxID=148 RepID=UPI00035C112D|nr:cytosine permease [Sediminispirochaeta bajacaliforniensis]